MTCRLPRLPRTAGAVRGGVSSLLLLPLAAGCTRDWLPEDFFDPADCSTLGPVSDQVIEQIEEGQTVLTDQDARPGTARIILTVDTGDGPVWYSHLDDVEPWIISYYQYVGGYSYSTRVVLPCLPEAATFVAFRRSMFERPGPLDEGVYPVHHFGFDVSEREQGSEGRTWADAEMELTDVRPNSSGYKVSGFLRGRGGGSLKSFVSQEPVGFVYTVEALGFRDIQVW